MNLCRFENPAHDVCAGQVQPSRLAHTLEHSSQAQSADSFRSIQFRPSLRWM